jgi:hypothetical protein
MRHPRRKVGQWMNASILNAQSFSIICLLLLWGSARGEAPTSRSVRKRRLQRFEQQQLQQVYSAQPAPVSAYDEYLAEETLGQGVDGAVLLVPTELQGARYQALSKTHEYIQFLSFDDILPPSLGFSAVFNANSHFRRELRRAARIDFGASGSSDPSSASGKWPLVEYPATSLVLKKFITPSLSGELFFSSLYSLLGRSEGEDRFCFQSWMDIVGVRGRKINHSFHQDSGKPQKTIMIGFPPADDYEGLGVFSHAVKLSHRLEDHTQNHPRLWSDLKAAPLIEPCHVVKPRFVPGRREIMVYDDRDVFHSAPDFAHRDSIWRIM